MKWIYKLQFIKYQNFIIYNEEKYRWWNWIIFILYEIKFYYLKAIIKLINLNI